MVNQSITYWLAAFEEGIVKNNRKIKNFKVKIVFFIFFYKKILFFYTNRCLSYLFRDTRIHNRVVTHYGIVKLMNWFLIVRFILSCYFEVPTITFTKNYNKELYLFLSKISEKYTFMHTIHLSGSKSEFFKNPFARRRRRIM